MTEISKDLIWWITVVDIPAMSALFWMIWRTRGETQRRLDAVNHALDCRCEQLRDALASFKLEVAKNYASQNDLRLLEARLVEHLLRIEAKLDKTALRTARISGKD